jgi:hypothetical protein
MYPSVAQPNHLETVVANPPTGANGAKERWKYTRYFDDPAFCTSPGQKDVVTTIDGNVNAPGDKAAHTTVKVQPKPDEIEIYNTTKDPTEIHNLAARSRPHGDATIATDRRHTPEPSRRPTLPQAPHTDHDPSSHRHRRTVPIRSRRIDRPLLDSRAAPSVLDVLLSPATSTAHNAPVP